MCICFASSSNTEFSVVEKKTEPRRKLVVKHGILGPLSRFLVKVEPANELQYWSLMVVHQLAASGRKQRERDFVLSFQSKKLRTHMGCSFFLFFLKHIIVVLHPDLINVGLIRTLAEMSRLSFGNANMPKICLQSLVRLVVTMDDDSEVRFHLAELLPYDIVPLIATYIRSDDFELVYWAVGLMHEFAIKGVALEEFKAVRGLCRSMNVLLAADDSHIARIILRTLKYMMLDDGKTQYIFSFVFGCSDFIIVEGFLN